MFDFLGFTTNNNEDKSKKELTSPSIVQEEFRRYEGNPIITPNSQFSWKARATYNPAIVQHEGKINIIYRAQALDGVSVFGYASTTDGVTIQENLDEPIYSPRESFEMSTKPGWNSGCEDPRITKIGNRFYMTYTAYDGTNPPRVALTSISVSDFVSKSWNWDSPKLISPPGVDDKDSCIIKKVRGDGYFAFHRLGNVIWIDDLRDLEFPETKFLTGGIMAQARTDNWDNIKIGIAGPPIMTDEGWILLYHAVCNPGFMYKIGAMLLDFEDPKKILGRTEKPLLEPEMDYEQQGQVPNVIFSCGTAVLNGVIYMYYGGADSVIGVATMPLSSLLPLLQSS